ncbi:alpha/beta fold hydrolase [Macrococcus equipercicus]|uniref:Alpha/beta hydrolase n=1 Tax=Macrococcus equipercicus TaxID=69967 RepID=A0A9Q9F1C0_9STAP|nr:alpha/beta hydrolase [Macrococcus equipercicus]KAA1038386.1 alpha/beta hydrolase [Macrococcus equipercicus]UTH13226.1 alpha/beta hydrolase [Macrococcus equipercicus]
MWKWETEKAAKGVVVIVHNMLEHHGRYAWLITQLRRSGYHVVMGDLPGQGQTSRVNKGHIESFGVYREAVLEWIEVAEEYRLPVFLFGIGLGGLIAVNLLERVTLNLEGLILISPLFGFQNTLSTRKNIFASSFGGTSKDAKFDMNIAMNQLTRSADAVKDAESDSLMISKVSFNWYRSIMEAMKDTMENIPALSSVPLLLMYAGEDKLADLEQTRLFSKEFQTDEMYVKCWNGLYHELHQEPEKENILRYIESFMNNRIYYVGLISE